MVTDFEYDVMQKKRIASQARYRRTHTGKGGCHLSSDYLTQKQWKERCGSVVTCSLNRPIPWKEFQKLSKPIQEEYIQTLHDRFHANATSLADMFGVTPQTVRRLVSDNGFDVKFSRGRSMSKAQSEVWERFCSAEPELVETEEPEATEDTEEIQPVADEQPTIKTPPYIPMDFDGFTLRFVGAVDLAKLMNSIRSMIGENAEGTIVVSYHK